MKLLSNLLVAFGVNWVCSWLIDNNFNADWVIVLGVLTYLFWAVLTCPVKQLEEKRDG